MTRKKGRRETVTGRRGRQGIGDGQRIVHSADNLPGDDQMAFPVPAMCVPPEPPAAVPQAQLQMSNLNAVPNHLGYWRVCLSIRKQSRITSRTSRAPSSADPISSPINPARPIKCSSWPIRAQTDAIW